MSYIVSTRNPEGIYGVLVESCKKHSEKLLNKKLQIVIFKKKISLVFFFFFIHNILNLKIFSDEYFVKLKYKKFDIGRHAYASTLRNRNAYLNFFWLNYYKIKYFYEAGLIIESSINLLDKSDALYVDHGVYLNGLIIQVFANNKKIIYQNVYPRGLSFKDLRKNKSKYILSYEDILLLRKKEIKLNKIIKQKSKNKLKQILKKPHTIPWIKGIKFSGIKYKNLKSITHVVYAHSFADGQLVWGIDDFTNMREWLLFTLDNLDKNENKILVKAHPNFTIRGYFNDACKLDREIFFQIKDKFKNSKNIIFETKPTRNLELLKKLNKKTILVSHHGSAILEGSYLNFKTISSEATFWENKFKITNSWKNKFYYSGLLKNNWENLSYRNYNDLLTVSYLLYCNDFGHYGKKFWHQVISDVEKITRKKLDKNIDKHINNVKNKNNLITALSQNIQKI